MKLAGEQLVLDTNILVHLLRGKHAGQVIERGYEIGQRTPRAIISVVTKGELKALAYKFEWGPDKRERLDAMLAGLPAADISHGSIHDAYAAIDFAGLALGVKDGQERPLDRGDNAGRRRCVADHGRRLRSPSSDGAPGRAYPRGAAPARSEIRRRKAFAERLGRLTAGVAGRRTRM